eukprot:10510451-Alexandrium_andersonii.AAC.1
MGRDGQRQAETFGDRQKQAETGKELAETGIDRQRLAEQRHPEIDRQRLAETHGRVCDGLVRRATSTRVARYRCLWSVCAVLWIWAQVVI